MSNFQIRRLSPHSRVSINIPFAAPRGTAIQVDTTTPANGALATADYVGFLTRDVVASLDVSERAIWPGRLELPTLVGEQATLERADAIEVEGADYIVLSGTGAITGGTTLGTELSFAGGKLRQKQASDRAIFKLREFVTPLTGGNLRLFAEAIV